MLATVVPHIESYWEPFILENINDLDFMNVAISQYFIDSFARVYPKQTSIKVEIKSHAVHDVFCLLKINQILSKSKNNQVNVCNKDYVFSISEWRF